MKGDKNLNNKIEQIDHRLRRVETVIEKPTDPGVLKMEAAQEAHEAAETSFNTQRRKDGMVLSLNSMPTDADDLDAQLKAKGGK